MKWRFGGNVGPLLDLNYASLLKSTTVNGERAIAGLIGQPNLRDTCFMDSVCIPEFARYFREAYQEENRLAASFGVVAEIGSMNDRQLLCRCTRSNSP